MGMSASRTGGQFTRGAFWKKFDTLRGGEVVNYDQHWLPGQPVLSEITYPNEGRRYFRKGDKILLLNYKNEPYRIVYDTMKMIDENNIIGVMHLGQFPDGIEFATFTMMRHNYPLELMSVDDYRLVAADPRTRTPTAADLTGHWAGRLITLAHPTISLLTQTNPVTLAGDFAADGSSSFRIAGVGVPFVGGKIGDLRLVDSKALIGKWDVGSALGWLAPLQDCVEPSEGKFLVHFILMRT
jgi:hypothetical protein